MLIKRSGKDKSPTCCSVSSSFRLFFSAGSGGADSLEAMMDGEGTTEALSSSLASLIGSGFLRGMVSVEVEKESSFAYKNWNAGYQHEMPEGSYCYCRLTAHGRC
jgi:hypothetical protein